MNEYNFNFNDTYIYIAKNTFWVYLKKLFKNYAKLSHFYIKTHIIQNKFLHFPSLYFIPFNLYQWRQVLRKKSIILFWIKFSTIWKIKKGLNCMISVFYSVFFFSAWTKDPYKLILIFYGFCMFRFAKKYVWSFCCTASKKLMNTGKSLRHSIDCKFIRSKRYMKFLIKSFPTKL
jgi:hypothetical protein